MLNNSGVTIFPGDMVRMPVDVQLYVALALTLTLTPTLNPKQLEWAFHNQTKVTKPNGGRGTSRPRRITVKVATAASERVIGRALSFAKPGEPFDLLIKSC